MAITGDTSYKTCCCSLPYSECCGRQAAPSYAASFTSPVSEMSGLEAWFMQMLQRPDVVEWLKEMAKK